MDAATHINKPIASPEGEPQAARPSRLLALYGLVMLTGVFVVSVWLNPPGGDYFTICGFKNLTGLPCPGCGLTHSFCALGKGHLLAAFGFNLLGPMLFLIFALVWFRSACVLLNKTSISMKVDQWMEGAQIVRRMTIAFLVFGAGRIVYLLVFHPETWQASPLMKWIARMLS
jgi:hypothetical protein